MTGSRDDGLDATKKFPAMPTAGYQTDAFTDPYGVTAPPKVRRHCRSRRRIRCHRRRL